LEGFRDFCKQVKLGAIGFIAEEVQAVVVKE
jgi:predicted DNA-binding transcriptional regulator AlpA